MLVPTLADAVRSGLLSQQVADQLASLSPDAVPVGCTEAGCGLALNTVGLKQLTDPDEVHAWRLYLNQGRAVRILLTALTVDYDLHVFGPDGLLSGEVVNDEPDDHVVELEAPADGQFVVYVNSGRGDVSDQAYALAVLPL
jgi:hypothetical protein